MISPKRKCGASLEKRLVLSLFTHRVFEDVAMIPRQISF